MSIPHNRAVLLFDPAHVKPTPPGRLSVREQQVLMRWAFRDDLTGVLNRRGFRLLASRRLAAARRRGGALLLLYADIDGFKQINDSFGHAEGDRALVRTAATFRKAFRKSDLIARFGGDEFVALVTEEPGCSAPALCQRLQRLFRCSPPAGYRLSVTAGIIRFTRDGMTSLESLLEAADGRLYSSKLHRRRLTFVSATGRRVHANST